MPNLITHTIFAHKAIEYMEPEYQNVIKKYPCEYRIGANGPDFLFFYDIFPIWKKQSKKIPNIGRKIHANKINVFYQTALETYHRCEDKIQKEAMATYITGHYLHWQLDSIMHPYVVYRTGFKEKYSSGYHHRMESMMDTILLKKYWHKSIKEFKTYRICKRTSLSEEIISSIYIPCVKTCLHKDINKEEIIQALKEWEKAQRYLYDPTGIKFLFVQCIETIINQKWSISGSIIKAKIDTKYDICNEEHTTWHHPCTNKESNQSVYDLMEVALQNSKTGLSYLWNALQNKEIEPFLQFLDNKTYTNGIHDNLPRIYKKVIYEEK